MKVAATDRRSSSVTRTNSIAWIVPQMATSAAVGTAREAITIVARTAWPTPGGPTPCPAVVPVFLNVGANSVVRMAAVAPVAIVLLAKTAMPRASVSRDPACPIAAPPSAVMTVAAAAVVNAWRTSLVKWANAFLIPAFPTVPTKSAATTVVVVIVVLAPTRRSA